MRRALAFIVAAGLIAGSLALRDRIDDRSERKSTVVRLVCATELAAACDELAKSRDIQVRTVVEPAGATTERLSKPGEIDLDGWLVMPPWPDVVDNTRERAGLPRLFGAVGEPVARSPLVLAVRDQREATLRTSSSCGGTIGWRCVGDAAAATSWETIGGRPEWGRVKPEHPDPLLEATGLLLVGQASADYFGRTDLSSTTDLRDDAFLAWLGFLERAVSINNATLETMLTEPAFVDVLGTIEAEAVTLIAVAATQDKPVVLYPQPMATADAVFAPVAGRRVSGTLRDLVTDGGRQALAAAGWRVAGQPLAEGLEPRTLPPNSGLPSAGLLEALRGPISEIR